MYCVSFSKSVRVSTFLGVCVLLFIYAVSSSICDVEFEKMTVQQNGNVFRMEANLEVDGKLYRAEATMDSFEKAIDEVRSELDKELRRANSKKETLFKRGGRKIKEMLRFGS